MEYFKCMICACKKRLMMNFLSRLLCWRFNIICCVVVFVLLLILNFIHCFMEFKCVLAFLIILDTKLLPLTFFPRGM